jgi:hypothetical protein
MKKCKLRFPARSEIASHATMFDELWRLSSIVILTVSKNSNRSVFCFWSLVFPTICSRELCSRGWKVGKRFSENHSWSIQNGMPSEIEIDGFKRWLVWILGKPRIQLPPGIFRKNWG